MNRASERAKKGLAKSVYLSMAPEFFGTLLFSFLAGSMVAVTNIVNGGGITLDRAITVAFIDGFLYYAMVFITMKLSNQTSGYLNPAFSTGLLIVNLYTNLSIWFVIRAVAYIIVQLVGGIAGVALVLAIISDRKALAVPMIATPPAAFALTAVLSCFLLFVILSVRNNEGRMSSLIMCFAYIAARAISFPVCGGHLNPARSLAHALLSGSRSAMNNLWVDMGGAMTGCIVAGFCYLAWIRKWNAN